VLPDASRPEGSIAQSRYKVSEDGEGGYGAVFGVMVQNLGLIRVSRYNADRKQVGNHLIVILLTALAQYRGTR
jgi:hypothetical protein